MEKKKKITLSALFVLVSLLLGEDLISDWLRGASIFHLIEEILVVCLLLIGVIYIWRDNTVLKADLSRVKIELEKVKKESLHWIEKNKTLIKGMSEAIDHQMDQWHLTTSEKEIALLLMKGLSMKEISEIRNTAEHTVRQQSLSIYHKSGLNGRAELSAFFLEDLLAPTR